MAEIGTRFGNAALPYQAVQPAVRTRDSNPMLVDAQFQIAPGSGSPSMFGAVARISHAAAVTIEGADRARGSASIIELPSGGYGLITASHIANHVRPDPARYGGQAMISNPHFFQHFGYLNGAQFRRLDSAQEDPPSVYLLNQIGNDTVVELSRRSQISPLKVSNVPPQIGQVLGIADAKRMLIPLFRVDSVDNHSGEIRLSSVGSENYHDLPPRACEGMSGAALLGIDRNNNPLPIAYGVLSQAWIEVQETFSNGKTRLCGMQLKGKKLTNSDLLRRD